MLKINSQNLLAISVLLVSVSAVVVAFFQANIMKEQQEIMHKDFEASLWPHIDLGYNYNPQEHFEITVENNGVGPAIIEGISIKRGDEYLKTWNDIQELIVSDSVFRFGVSNSAIVETVLSAGEQRKIYAVYNDHAAQALFKVFDELEFTICYKSVYDSYWQHKRFFEGNRTVAKIEETDGCNISEEQSFNDVLEL